METENKHHDNFTLFDTIPPRFKLVFWIGMFFVGWIAVVFIIRQPNLTNQPPKKNISPTPTPSEKPWKVYLHPDIEYSFRYPIEATLHDKNPKEVSVYFAGKDTAGNSGHFMIRKTNNIFNRPLESYVQKELPHELYLRAKAVYIAGLPARLIPESYGENTSLLIMQNQDTLYEINFYNYGPLEKNGQLLTRILETLEFGTSEKVEPEVFTYDGDIMVVKDGKKTQITDWGYNTSPQLSPDKTKVAYISKSEESFENEEKDIGFKRTSTNVWIVDADGTNPIQLTKHTHFVYRDNLHWLNNDTLLFQDGAETIKTYSLSKKTYTTIIGSEQPVATCVDACGYELAFYFSGDRFYLYRIESGGGDYSKVSIINLATLHVTDLPELAYQINHESIHANDDNVRLDFDAYFPGDNQKKIRGTIDPATATATLLN